jgi:hypothetical protein
MKNLKVGDTFVEGNQTYIVDEIVPLGYNAHAIGKTTEKIKETPKEEPIIDEPAYSKTQINRMPNAELEKVCKELGIEVGTGTEMKRAIIAKLGL